VFAAVNVTTLALTVRLLPETNGVEINDVTSVLKRAVRGEWSGRPW